MISTSKSRQSNDFGGLTIEEVEDYVNDLIFRVSQTYLNSDHHLAEEK